MGVARGGTVLSFTPGRRRPEPLREGCCQASWHEAEIGDKAAHTTNSRSEIASIIVPVRTAQE